MQFFHFGFYDSEGARQFRAKLRKWRRTSNPHQRKKRKRRKLQILRRMEQKNSNWETLFGKQSTDIKFKPITDLDLMKFEIEIDVLLSFFFPGPN